MIPRAIIKTADCRARDSEPDAPGLSGSLAALDLDYSQGSPNRCGTGTSFVAVTGGRASHREDAKRPGIRLRIMPLCCPRWRPFCRLAGQPRISRLSGSGRRFLFPITGRIL